MVRGEITVKERGELGVSVKNRKKFGRLMKERYLCTQRVE